MLVYPVSYPNISLKVAVLMLLNTTHVKAIPVPVEEKKKRNILILHGHYIATLQTAKKEQV